MTGLFGYRKVKSVPFWIGHSYLTYKLTIYSLGHFIPVLKISHIEVYCDTIFTSFEKLRPNLCTVRTLSNRNNAIIPEKYTRKKLIYKRVRF